MFRTYELGLKHGEVAGASSSLSTHIRWLFFAGEKLPSLHEKFKIYLPQIAKYNKEAAKLAVLDASAIDLLMGLRCESFSVFEYVVGIRDLLCQNPIAIIRD